MMAFKDKDRAMSEIMAAAESEAQYWSQALYSRPMNDALAQIIGHAVAAGIKRALELQYSHEEFEQDIGLKD